MRYDISQELGVHRTVGPRDLDENGTVNGTAVDLAGFHAAMAIIDVGTRTDGTHLVALHHATDDGTGQPDSDSWADVPAADLVGDLPIIDSTDAHDRTYRVGYTGIRRHLRVSISSTDTTDGLADVAAYIVAGKPASAPVG